MVCFYLPGFQAARKCHCHPYNLRLLYIGQLLLNHQGIGSDHSCSISNGCDLSAIGSQIIIVTPPLYEMKVYCYFNHIPVCLFSSSCFLFSVLPDVL